ncbi:MAG TPA: lysylphosphatidylglycerol synthase transmembrane domain-containing protein [Longimicrobiales bacterium]
MTRGAGRRRSVLDWKAVVGIALGIGLLVYSLRDVDAGEVLAEIGRADPWLLLLGVAAVTAPIATRAWRWKSLLEPVRRDTAFRSRFRATMIGFMANNVLPARIGEFARAYSLSRMEPVPVAASLGSLVLERIFDGIVVVSLLFLAMAMPGFPSLDALGVEDPARAARFVGALMAGLVAALVVLVAWPRRAVAVAEAVARRVLPASFRRPVVDALEAFLTGIASLRDPVLLLRAAHWSVWTWVVPGIGFWIAFRAFDIDAPFAAALFLQSLIALAVALPAAPGFFGLWEFAARVGLHDIYGIELDKATGFAIGFHMGGFLSVTIWGLFYAWRLGLSWREVEGSEATVESKTGAKTTPRGRGAGGDAR